MAAQTHRLDATVGSLKALLDGLDDNMIVRLSVEGMNGDTVDRFTGPMTQANWGGLRTIDLLILSDR